MDITLQRANNQVHFIARNSEGNTVDIDGSPAIGGQGKGFRPMELLLAATAGCASMDLIPILRKQRQSVDDVAVRVRGRRVEGRTPAPFEKIEIAFLLCGDVDRISAEQAAALAVEKYCSVAESLSPRIKVSWSVDIVPPGQRATHAEAPSYEA